MTTAPARPAGEDVDGRGRARARPGRRTLVLPALLTATLVLFLLAITTGSVSLGLTETLAVLFGQPGADPAAQTLITRVRLPRAVTAACAGAALAAAGLQLQTLFRNPLADPFSLGVSAGASLGVAVLLTGFGATAGAGFVAGLGLLGRFGTVSAAAAGAALVLALVLVLARTVRVPATLLIIGVMLGSAVTALVSLLLTWTNPQRAQAYIVWGLGSFSGTSGPDVAILAGFTVVGLAAALATVKPLNALLLGEHYARTMGVNVAAARAGVLIGACLLTGAVTAFCGPIGFLGIAVPHAARRLVGTSDHRHLMPASILTGAAAALCCSILSLLPSQVVPINVITSLIGAPIVVAILLRSRSVQGVS